MSDASDEELKARVNKLTAESNQLKTQIDILDGEYKKILEE